MKNYKTLTALPIATLLTYILIQPIGLLPYYLLSDTIYLFSNYVDGLVPVAIYAAHAYILQQFGQHRFSAYSHLIVSCLWLIIFVVSQVHFEDDVMLDKALMLYSTLKLVIMLLWIFQLASSTLLSIKALRSWYIALISLALLTSILEHLSFSDIVIYVARYGVWLYVLQNLLLIAFYLQVDKMRMSKSF